MRLRRETMGRASSARSTLCAQRERNDFAGSRRRTPVRDASDVVCLACGCVAQFAVRKLQRGCCERRGCRKDFRRETKSRVRTKRAYFKVMKNRGGMMKRMALLLVANF